MEIQNINFYKELYDEDELFLLEEGQEFKDICLILDKKLTPKNEEFLTKILAAVNQSLLSVTKIFSANIEDVSTLETKKVLIFDDVNFNSLPFYQIVENNGLFILKSNSLDTINADKVLKGTLWAQLQKMFL